MSRTTGSFPVITVIFRFWTFVLFHGLSRRHHSQENPNEIWINVQGCFVIQLSRFCFRAKAFIFYHIDFCLSRTFLNNFQLLFESFFALNSLGWVSRSFKSCNFYIISHIFYFVKSFFIFLKEFFHLSFKLMCSHVRRMLSYHRVASSSRVFFIFLK